MPLPRKAYLGDGVYIEHSSETGELILTTEDGVRTTNTIVFDGEVLSNFLTFVENLPGFSKE
jgi:hypothetical protein